MFYGDGGDAPFLIKEVHMKGKYFFIENGKHVEIKEFDYEYVLNSLLKEFDRSKQRVYNYTVVIDCQYDSFDNPTFSVRTLNLKDIYFSNINLSVLDLMMDSIYNDKTLKVRDLPMPRLQREYMVWKENRKVTSVSSSVVIPALPTRERVEIDVNDKRIPDIVVFGLSIEKQVKELEVLDWIENFPIRSNSLSTNIQKVSENQIALTAAMSSHSTFMNGFYANITNVLESLFPIKTKFIYKIFGEPEIVIEEENLETILTTLSNAVVYDVEHFKGIQLMFDSINSNVDSISEDLEQGLIGCQYQIQHIEDPYEWELSNERLNKISISNDLTRGTVATINKRFKQDINRISEIKDVLIPLIMQKI